PQVVHSGRAAYAERSFLLVETPVDNARLQRSPSPMAQLNKVHSLPKQPPHSIEAEQSLLGGLMLDNRVFYDLADRLHAADFYRADHQLIYRAISDLISATKPCDFVTLSEHLRNKGTLEEAGGIAYL